VANNQDLRVVSKQVGVDAMIIIITIAITILIIYIYQYIYQKIVCWLYKEERVSFLVSSYL
jgi:hypothetical protein